MEYYSTFPFYMGYQGYGQWAQPGVVPEDRILEDLEYLQQMYPTYARKYQNTIGSVVDKMDYDGSFIYGQYPDKLTLQRMVESVVAIIRTNEEAAQGMAENPVQGGPDQDVAASDAMDRALTEQAPWREKEPWIRELVTVLMYYEILTRRRKRSKTNRYYQF